MTPRVSVVIPSYNNGPFIRAAVDSVLSQTFTDYELIVADHSSTDDTWQALQEYAGHPQVRLLITPPGGGAAANWNAVTEQARGTYLKLLCGDDLIYPTCLAEQVEQLEQPGAVLVASPRDVIDARDGVIIRGRGLQGIKKPMDGLSAARKAALSGSNIFGEPGCVLMRRDILERVGGWDARDPYVIDLQTYCHVLQHGSYRPALTTLAAFRMNRGQWTMQLAASQKHQVQSFQRRITEEYGVLSRSELAFANARASATAVARRAAYLWMRRKLVAAQ